MSSTGAVTRAKFSYRLEFPGEILSYIAFSSPLTFQNNNIDNLNLLQQIVNMPESFLLLPEVPLDSSLQAVHGGAHIGVKS